MARIQARPGYQSGVESAGRRAVPDPERLTLHEASYDASGGREWFLSWEDDATETVAAFLRLRVPSGDPEALVPDPIVRELKVLGQETPVGQPASAGGYQHRGLGRSLLQRAEEKAREVGGRRLAVMAAVGTRTYYRALGYEPSGPHVVKPLFS